jgi:hypothetical protein
MIHKLNFFGSLLTEEKRANMQCMLSQTQSRMSRLLLEIFVFGIGMILICSMVTCANESGKNPWEGTQVSRKTIEEVLKAHISELMSIPGVVGTGQSLCNGQPCIKIYVSRKTEELEQKIPKTLEGYPVVIQETGEFKALPDN